CMQTLDFPLTF
nr:immunoglobulin light chain junction region [Macaca mulatta]MOW41067.1 immunoglobulin light chain junction region [Macaca mulatta]